jgi:hypothetical protein
MYPHVCVLTHPWQWKETSGSKVRYEKKVRPRVGDGTLIEDVHEGLRYPPRGAGRLTCWHYLIIKPRRRRRRTRRRIRRMNKKMKKNDVEERVKSADFFYRCTSVHAHSRLCETTTTTTATSAWKRTQLWFCCTKSDPTMRTGRAPRRRSLAMASSTWPMGEVSPRLEDTPSSVVHPKP